MKQMKFRWQALGLATVLFLGFALPVQAAQPEDATGPADLPGPLPVSSTAPSSSLPQPPAPSPLPGEDAADDDSGSGEESLRPAAEAAAQISCPLAEGCPLQEGHEGPCPQPPAPLAAAAPRASVTTGYFYDRLTDVQKQLYEALVAAATPTGGLMGGTAEVGTTYTLPAGTSAFKWATDQKFGEVSFAVIRDHPEIFWLDYDQLGGFAYEDLLNGTVRIYITLSGGATSYLMKGFANQAEVESAKAALDAKVAEILAASASDNRYQTLRMFNNWLVNNNIYNSKAYADREYRKAWSAVSGLLSNNDANTGPVCFGYTAAMKVLCDAAGIPCLVVEGDARYSASRKEGHAWNYVQMEDGNWYAIDSTWNDNGPQALMQYFLVGANTEYRGFGAGYEKFSQNHVPSKNRYPALAASAYSGFVPVAQVGNVTYSSLQKAVDSATQPVRLLQNVELESTLVVANGAVDIQFQGYSIRDKVAPYVNTLVEVKPGATLTLMNHVAHDLNDPNNLGDLYMSGDGTVVNNQGSLVLRDASLTAGTLGTAVGGNAYTMGPNSLLYYEDKRLLNVREAAMPQPSPGEIDISPDELPANPTLADLTAKVRASSISLTHTLSSGGSIRPNLQQSPSWATDATSLSYGTRYTYYTSPKLYGYTVPLTVTYRYPATTPLTGSVSINGTTQVGSTLTAVTTGLTRPGPGALSYQWKRGGSPIAGQTASRYTLQAADGGQKISVSVSAANYTGQVTSAELAVPLPPPAPSSSTPPSSSSPPPISSTPPASSSSTPPPASSSEAAPPQPTGQWHDYGGRWCYLFRNGSWAYGWAYIDGQWYYFDGGGYMQTGWLHDGSSWYYMAGSGAMHTGWLYDGSWYYMRGNGQMASGWVMDGSNWYYMKASGQMQTGWLYNGSWYYLHGGGQMASGWIWDGSSWYYMGGSGAMHTGWLYDGASWFYLNANGVMASGQQTVEGAVHQFAANGVWLGAV